MNAIDQARGVIDQAVEDVRVEMLVELGVTRAELDGALWDLERIRRDEPEDAERLGVLLDVLELMVEDRRDRADSVVRWATAGCVGPHPDSQ